VFHLGSRETSLTIRGSHGSNTIVPGIVYKIHAFKIHGTRGPALRLTNIARMACEAGNLKQFMVKTWMNPDASITGQTRAPLRR
jgi:hypothetical protein